MTRQTVTIETADGACETSVFRPEGKGPWPALLFFMDGVGIRPALFEMGERMAAAGYFVLLPDLFHRAGPYTAPDPAKLFSDPELRASWSKKVGGLTPDGAMRDTKACLDFLSRQPDVKQPEVGVTGYCMGGRLAVWAAATFPDRIVAAAAFHPGGLVTDAPDSPHLLAPKIKGKIYVAGAIEDAHFTDAQKATFDEALTEAGVDHVVTTYRARHGWVPRDTPIHDEHEAERHYEALFALLASSLS